MENINIEISDGFDDVDIDDSFDRTLLYTP